MKASLRCRSSCNTQQQRGPPPVKQASRRCCCVPHNHLKVVSRHGCPVDVGDDERGGIISGSPLPVKQSMVRGRAAPAGGLDGRYAWALLDRPQKLVVGRHTVDTEGLWSISASADARSNRWDPPVPPWPLTSVPMKSLMPPAPPPASIPPYRSQVKRKSEQRGHTTLQVRWRPRNWRRGWAHPTPRGFYSDST